MRSLALIALIALCVSVGARADTDEPFNGAVHSDPGTDTAVDDGMTEEAHAVAWIDVEMNGDIFVTRKSWQPPQYHLEDDTYVRMRGWVSTIRAAAAGEAVFRLPEDARPGRAEPWKVSMKGTDREILLGKFILIRGQVRAIRLTSRVFCSSQAAPREGDVRGSKVKTSGLLRHPRHLARRVGARGEAGVQATVHGVAPRQARQLQR